MHLHGDVAPNGFVRRQQQPAHDHGLVPEEFDVQVVAAGERGESVAAVFARQRSHRDSAAVGRQVDERAGDRRACRLLCDPPRDRLRLGLPGRSEQRERP